MSGSSRLVLTVAVPCPEQTTPPEHRTLVVTTEPSDSSRMKVPERLRPGPSAAAQSSGKRCSRKRTSVCVTQFTVTPSEVVVACAWKVPVQSAPRSASPMGAEWLPEPPAGGGGGGDGGGGGWPSRG